MAQGAKIKATLLTEEFPVDAFRERHGEDAIPLFLLTESGRLVVVAGDPTEEPAACRVEITLRHGAPLG